MNRNMMTRTISKKEQEVLDRYGISRNESLDLNESKQGLVDYFYDLVYNIGMDTSKQVDHLLSYINESDLLEAIDDLKAYMGIED